MTLLIKTKKVMNLLAALFEMFKNHTFRIVFLPGVDN